MSMTNRCQSSQSPFGSERVSLNRRFALIAMLTIVLISIVFNTCSAVRHWSELTFAHYLIGIAIWAVLPIVAVALVFQGRTLGRWILIVSYGCRGAAATFYLAWLAHLYGAFVLPGWSWPVCADAVFHLGAAAWLLYSPSLRQLCSKKE